MLVVYQLRLKIFITRCLMPCKLSHSKTPLAKILDLSQSFHTLHLLSVLYAYWLIKRYNFIMNIYLFRVLLVTKVQLAFLEKPGTPVSLQMFSHLFIFCKLITTELIREVDKVFAFVCIRCIIYIFCSKTMTPGQSTNNWCLLREWLCHVGRYSFINCV